ncbi:hypothetical protein [Xanthomonas phage AhaSv]|nr:hypothetical protein [Xanthomonas phage AhaSv]
MKLHSINTEQRVYVMPAGNGFSCYGFDVLDRKARTVAAWISREGFQPRINDIYDFKRVAGFNPGEPGTAEHFAACAQMMERGRQFAAQTGKRCPAELVPAFIGREGERVECDYYGERVRFYIGKSTGWMPAHLRIRTRRSSGGEALSASAISNIRFI